MVGNSSPAVNACQQTFQQLRPSINIPDDLKFMCPNCDSLLVRQDQPENTDSSEAACTCQSCGMHSSFEKVMEASLQDRFSGEIYTSFTDGDDNPVGQCSGCGAETMVLFTGEQQYRCPLCGTALEEKCLRCREKLTPASVASGETGKCSNCAFVR